MLQILILAILLIAGSASAQEVPFKLPQAFKVIDHCATLTTSTPSEIVASPGTNTRGYLSSLSVTNAHATVGTVVQILNGATSRWEVYAAPNGGGEALPFPLPLQGALDTAWSCGAVTSGSSIRCCLAVMVPAD